MNNQENHFQEMAKKLAANAAQMQFDLAHAEVSNNELNKSLQNMSEQLQWYIDNYGERNDAEQTEGDAE